MQAFEKDIIKVLDHNICLSNCGPNRMIVDRLPRLMALIDDVDPDLIGIQEADVRWMARLIENLPKRYAMKYNFRGGPGGDSCTPVIWNQEKLEMLAFGHYFLSDTPDIPSPSFAPEGPVNFYRTCNWVKLKVKESGRIFIFINTHLSGGVPAQKSAPLIAKRTREIGGMTTYPVIFTGDFNSVPESEAYRAFHENRFTDINAELGFDSTITLNGYDDEDYPDRLKIILDYIMCGGDRNMIVPLKYQVVHNEYFGGYISDHKGLYGEFALLN